MAAIGASRPLPRVRAKISLMIIEPGSSDPRRASAADQCVADVEWSGPEDPAPAPVANAGVRPAWNAAGGGYPHPTRMFA